MNEINNLILLVEDNKNDELLAVRAFKKSSVENEVDIARDGAEALDYLFSDESHQKQAPALILLDLNLPKINGLEVLKRLKEEASTANIPVVVMTSSDEDSDINNSYLYGANSYIRKPVDFQEFLSLISRLATYWLTLNETAKVSQH